MDDERKHVSRVLLVDGSRSEAGPRTSQLH